MIDPLLSDDLSVVLPVLPSEALAEIVGVLKRSRSITPFPMPVAVNARKAGDKANLATFADEIAREILWWGSNDISRQFNGNPNWRDIVTSLGDALEVASSDLQPDLPISVVEGATLCKAIPNWEALSVEKRREKLRESGKQIPPMFGLFGSLPTLGVQVAARAGLTMGTQAVAAGAATTAATGVAATGTAAVATTVAGLAATTLPIAAAVAGTGYTVFKLSGPGYRVIRPVVLLVAYWRQRSRDLRNFKAFAF